MNVLHVGKYYPPVPGGMERVLQLLCEGERRQIDSRVLVAGTERVTRHEIRNGVPVTRAGSLAMMGSVGLAARVRVERESTADRMAERIVALYREVLAGEPALGGPHRVRAA